MRDIIPSHGGQARVLRICFGCWCTPFLCWPRSAVPPCLSAAPIERHFLCCACFSYRGSKTGWRSAKLAVHYFLEMLGPAESLPAIKTPTACICTSKKCGCCTRQKRRHIAELLSAAAALKRSENVPCMCCLHFTWPQKRLATALLAAPGTTGED